MRLSQIPKKKLFVFVLIVVLSFSVVHIVLAVTADPGSDTDPVVTQSYVDAKVNDLISKLTDLTAKVGTLNDTVNGQTAKQTDLTNSVNDLTAKVADLTRKVTDQAAQIQTLQQQNTDQAVQIQMLQQQGGTFQKIKVTAGKKLLLGIGTELILRTGQAKAISGAAGGLADVTAGKDLTTGSAVLFNHLLFSAVDDGRGLKVDTDVWVLVKGAYTVK